MPVYRRQSCHATGRGKESIIGQNGNVLCARQASVRVSRGLFFIRGDGVCFLHVLYWQENVIVVSDRYRIQAMDTDLEKGAFELSASLYRFGARHVNLRVMVSIKKMDKVCYRYGCFLYGVVYRGCR